MNTINSDDFQQQLGLYEHKALHEPVRVTFDTHEPLILVAESEFSRLQSLDRMAIAVGSLTDEELADIAQARVPSEYGYLDKLL